MPLLPIISGREAVDAFKQAGWMIARTEGSHVIMTKTGKPVTLSVPNHHEVKRGTLRSLIRKAELTVGDFVSLLND